MKLRSFISRLQDLDTYLGESPPITPGQENLVLPVDEIMVIIYNSMLVTWKNVMIEQKINILP